MVADKPEPPAGGGGGMPDMGGMGGMGGMVHGWHARHDVILLYFIILTPLALLVRGVFFC